MRNKNNSVNILKIFPSEWIQAPADAKGSAQKRREIAPIRGVGAMLLCPFQQKLLEETGGIWLLLILEYSKHSYFHTFATEKWFVKRERVSPETTIFPDMVWSATLVSCWVQNWHLKKSDAAGRPTTTDSWEGKGLKSIYWHVVQQK